MDTTGEDHLEKYTERTKLAAVEAYSSGHLGLTATAKQYDVGVSSLRKWVAAYQAHGIAGIRAKRRELYAAEFKRQVLLRARAEGLSNRQAAALFDIRNFNIIAAWERAYEADGMAGLEPRPVGRRKQATRNEAPEKPRDPDDRECSRDQLLDELSSLRAENAYLKKADALVRSRTMSAPSKKRKS